MLLDSNTVIYAAIPEYELLRKLMKIRTSSKYAFVILADCSISMKQKMSKDLLLKTINQLKHEISNNEASSYDVIVIGFHHKFWVICQIPLVEVDNCQERLFLPLKPEKPTKIFSVLRSLLEASELKKYQKIRLEIISDFSPEIDDPLEKIEIEEFIALIKSYCAKNRVIKISLMDSPCLTGNAFFMISRWLRKLRVHTPQNCAEWEEKFLQMFDETNSNGKFWRNKFTHWMNRIDFYENRR
jgi:hypothetical protein